MSKLTIDETVYYMDGNAVRRGKIEGIRKKWIRGLFQSEKEIVYDINGKEFFEDDIFTSKSWALIKIMTKTIDFGDKNFEDEAKTYNKLKKVCKYLFPEEWKDSVEDEDFNTLDIEESKNLIEAWGRV